MSCSTEPPGTASFAHRGELGPMEPTGRGFEMDGKTGVRSRRELVVAILQEQYLP
jgi:hypothetical protein